jgi:hypothetical protein
MALRSIKFLCNGTIWAVICAAVAVTIFAAPQRRIDYSRFVHQTEQHRAACSSCHTFPSKNWKQVRKGDDAFPDITEFPEHQACLNCHRQQFFARERPVPQICSNCHVKATPIDTSRHPFPSLGETFRSTAKGRDFVSEFKIFFPQDKHEDAELPRSHSTCFTCHNQESELSPLPPNCDACHKLPAK